jgi:hypothetical protein
LCVKEIAKKVRIAGCVLHKFNLLHHKRRENIQNPQAGLRIILPKGAFYSNTPIKIQFQHHLNKSEAKCLKYY